MMSNTHANPPFAILLPYSPVPGSCELKMMPFNYPVILPLMQRTLEAIRRYNLPVAQTVKQPWMMQLQMEIYNYIFTVPSYAYHPVVDMLRLVGLIQYLKLDKSQDDHIHKVPFKRIQAMKGIAISGESSLFPFVLMLDLVLFLICSLILLCYRLVYFSKKFIFNFFLLQKIITFLLPCPILPYPNLPLPTLPYFSTLLSRYILNASSSPQEVACAAPISY